MIHTKPSMSLYQGTRGAAAGGFQLDLATHDAHKTASIFGPSSTPVPAAACALLSAWLAKAGLDAAAKPYVFVLGNPARGGATDHAAPLNCSHVHRNRRCRCDASSLYLARARLPLVCRACQA